MSKMTHEETFALNEWLTEYPDNMEYDDVLELIRAEDESVVVWQWFEYTPVTELIENIDNTKSHFEHTINSMKAQGAFA